MDWLEAMRQAIAPYRVHIIVFSYGLLVLGILQNLVYFVQLPLAALELKRLKLRSADEHARWLAGADVALPISILIPAYNESVTITATVRATLASQYPLYEVIVVNDGSKDDTLEVLVREFGLSPSQRFYENSIEHKPVRGIYTSAVYPHLVVVDKDNGGRSDALNTGIDLARHPLFCTLDADSLLDPTALLKTVQPFIDDPERMVASGGTIRISNGCKVENGIVTAVGLPRKLLPLFQVVEYIRAFLMGRLAWSRLGILTIISGAFAIFRRDIAVAAGGFNPRTIGEDFELVMKIHKHCRQQHMDYRMSFVPEPVCWTEVPESLEVMASQRIRWQQGGLEVFFRHKEMFMNPRYGRIGMLAYPLMFVFDVVAPLAELIGYALIPLFYLLGAIDLSLALAFFCLFFVLGIFISIMSLVLEELTLRRFNGARGLMLLGLVAVVENFGYRQYNNLWRMIGWWRFIRRKQAWGNMKRVGSAARITEKD